MIADEFTWRGLLYDATEDAVSLCARESVTVYVGFDPTASSLHIGSLLPIMALARLQRAGHRPIALIGGGTGLIGDPSGKSVERTLLSVEDIDANVQGIRSQLERFLDFDCQPNGAVMVNNADWLRSVGLLEFLRDTGKHFTVNYMMAKESVKRRIGSNEGISVTEFSYPLLQAYDYLMLHQRYGCQLQMGGSDQWGNITAGCDLIRKVTGHRAHGLVLPLVTTSAGTKFGKTEAGTVWLDPRLTSPYRFHQFWLAVDDRDVVRYLKFFTWLDEDQITALAQATERQPEAREAQRVLAREVTRLVHGDEEVQKAERASAMLFGGSLRNANVADLLLVFDDVPSTHVGMTELLNLSVATSLVRSGMCASKGEATRLIRQGGVSVNGVRVTDERQMIGIDDLLGGMLVVLQKGVRDRRLLRVTSTA